VALASSNCKSEALSRPFRRGSASQNVADRTVQTYCESVSAARELPLLARECPPPWTGSDVSMSRRFIEDLLTKFKPATAANRFGGLGPTSSGGLREGRDS